MGLLDFWKKKKAVKGEAEVVEPEGIEPVFEAPGVEPEPKVLKPKESEPKPERKTKEPIFEAEVVVEESVTREDGSRSFASRIRSLFSSSKLDPNDLESLEDILIMADFGVHASADIVSEVRKQANAIGASTEAELKAILVSVLTTALEIEGRALNLEGSKFPYVFLVVGVNGVGKTTTIGKLARWLAEGQWSVVIGAADTFRAAAVDQIQTWADRAGARLVRPKAEGQDPASVAFEAVETAAEAKADLVIIDTAGRLQNKSDLMDELGKIRRVVEKTVPVSEVLLVIDATTGQNGLQQAKAFAEVANVTGVVLTKVDGTAKGGIVYSIQRDLGIPVKLIGFGEGINDFAFFEADEFARGLVG
ncbi:MAG: signal recognition particle-docking protein FtsY [Micrococcales bacterium]